jgi:hypothetical protein
MLVQCMKLTFRLLMTTIVDVPQPLTSKVAFYIFIQQIQVPNILNMVYTVRFFLFKMQFVS